LLSLRLSWWRHGSTLTSWRELLAMDRVAPWLLLALIGLLMAAYVLGWYALRREGHADRPSLLIWGGAILFGATLFWLQPMTSDLYGYLVHAHLFTDLRTNPHLVAPANFPADAVASAYPTGYSAMPSIYGPAWTLLSAPGTLGQHDVAGGIAYLKGLALASYLACCWALVRIRGRIPLPIRPASEILYLFAWNPLVLLTAVGGGHNDIVIMALVLLAIEGLMNGRWTLAFAALTLSAWIKYISFIFLPLAVVFVGQSGRRTGERRWAPLLQGGLGVVGATAIAWIPFWTSSALTGPASELARVQAFRFWVLQTLERLVQPSNWALHRPDVLAWLLGAGLLLFLLLYLLVFGKLVLEGSPPLLMLEVPFVLAFSAFVLGAVRSQPWYLIWAVALAGLSQRRWVWPALTALSAAMLAGEVWVEWGAPGSDLIFS
jgi:hypothetical protein